MIINNNNYLIEKEKIYARSEKKFTYLHLIPTVNPMANLESSHQRIEDFKELIDLIPKLLEIADKCYMQHLQLREHPISQIRIERKALGDVLAIFRGKWTVDILFIICTLQGAFFNEIKTALPESSNRSLTNHLRQLEREGLISRQVIDAKPVRVKYFPTKIGKNVFLLTFPLLFHYLVPSSQG